MESFEELLAAASGALERFVYYHLPDKFDADDVLQEVRLTAYLKFDSLRDRSSFKPWLLAIARNKINDYFRRHKGSREISLDALPEGALAYGRCGRYIGAPDNPVRETVESLPEKEREVLILYYFGGLRQDEIAARLGIPVGTVKSRLHSAKAAFKERYPYSPFKKGTDEMKKVKMPAIMPEYRIAPSNLPSFSIIFEELTNWFIVPTIGEKVHWGSYDMPARNLTESVCSEVTNKIMLHGIEGVEIHTTFSPTDSTQTIDHIYYAQLTDTHCRWLGESYTDRNGMKKLLTFLDGDDFMEQWGFGEDNCGNETHLATKGSIRRNGKIVTTEDTKYLLDIVGRYTVEITDKIFDTVCVMMVYNDGVATEQYLDANGRTILWRRFNRDDWAIDRYKKPWTELLPDNERITVNGDTYVHWYDCITDYIL